MLTLALPAGAAEVGLSVEAQGALVLAQDGKGTSGTGGGGARLGLHVLEACDLHLRAELSWLRFGGSKGTDAVVVSSTFDELLLGLRAGWKLGGTELEVEPYAIAGPALSLVASEYRVADPLGLRTSPSASGTEAGAGYGVGVALLLVGTSPVRLASRVEAARIHRAGGADLALQAGLGVAF